MIACLSALSTRSHIHMLHLNLTFHPHTDTSHAYWLCSVPRSGVVNDETRHCACTALFWHTPDCMLPARGRDVEQGRAGAELAAAGPAGHFMLTKTLEWNLRWCILDSMFDDRHFRVARGFVHDPEALRQRFKCGASIRSQKQSQGGMRNFSTPRSSLHT